MPLLRNVEDTRTRLGFGEDADRDEAIEAHLETSVETLSDQLRTELTRVDVVDTFFVRQTLVDRSGFYSSGRYSNRRGVGIYAGYSASTVQLTLSRGFVASGGEITTTIYAAGTEDALDDATLRTDIQSVPGTSVDHAMIDYERGFVRVSDLLLNGAYVRVSYKAGFLDDDGSPPVFASTPEWLVRANDLEARILVNADAVFGRDQVNNDQQNTLERRLSNILMKHSRYYPMSEKPLHSVETASET